MKTTPIFLASLLAASSAFAANFNWDPALTNSATGGGAGTWDTTTANWFNGTADVTWGNTSADIAIFGGASGGAVALGTGVTAGGLTFNTAGYTISGNTLNLAGTPSITANADASISSILAGAGFTKSGTGVLTLSGVNTYTGATTLSGGVLAISNVGSLSSGNVAFDGGTLRLNAAAFTSGTATIANTLSVAATKTGVVDLIGSGVAANARTLTTGAITVDGTLRFTRSSGNNGGTNIGSTFTGAGTIEVGDTNGGVAITGAGNQGRFTPNNAGAFTGFTGSFNILNNGNLALFTAPTSASNNVAIAAGGYLSLVGGVTTTIGSLSGAGTVTRNTTTGGGAILQVSGGTFSGIINETAIGGAGTIALVKNTGGTLTLGKSDGTSINAYTGGTTVSNGILNLLAGSGGGAGVIRGAVTVNSGATLRISGSDALGWGVNNQVVTALTLDGGTLNVNSATNQGVFGMALTMKGGVINGSSGVSNGIQFNNNGVTNSSVATQASATTSTISGVKIRLQQAAGVTFTVAQGTTPSGIDLDVSSNMFGTGLTKAGAGTMRLSGTNTYTGTTTVSDGRLLINGNNSAATGAITVNGGTLGGTGTIGGAVTVNSGATLSPGASVQSLQTGAVTFNNTSTFAYELDSSALPGVGADLLISTGNLALVGTVSLTLDDLAVSDTAFAQNTTFTLINYGGTWDNGKFTFGSNVLDDGEEFIAGLNTWLIDYNATTEGSNFPADSTQGNFVNITAVPEPGAVLLGGLGLLALLRRRRA